MPRSHTPANQQHTKRPSKKRSLKRRKDFGQKTNYATKKGQTKRVARQTRSEQISLDTIPSTRPENSPTEEGAELILKSQKESITVQRTDLEATISLTLSIDGDEPHWLLTGTFNDLETAIRFVAEAWGSIWLFHHARTPLQHGGFNCSSTFHLWKRKYDPRYKERKTPSRNLLP